jgi:hypothetical protein
LKTPAVRLLAFEELANPHHRGQEVQLRGFIYQSADGYWYLANEPNLKSCCVGHGPKAAYQLLLTGEETLKPTLLAVTLNGVLQELPEVAEGAVRYQLANVQLQPTGPLLSPSFLFGALLAFVALAGWWWRQRRSHHS